MKISLTWKDDLDAGAFTQGSSVSVRCAGRPSTSVGAIDVQPHIRLGQAGAWFHQPQEMLRPSPGATARAMRLNNEFVWRRTA